MRGRPHDLLAEAAPSFARGLLLLGGAAGAGVGVWVGDGPAGDALPVGVALRLALPLESAAPHLRRLLPHDLVGLGVPVVRVARVRVHALAPCCEMDQGNVIGSQYLHYSSVLKVALLSSSILM